MCGITFTNPIGNFRVGSWTDPYPCRFIVHFRRPKDYTGTYGFDWLRDEYIHPIVTPAIYSISSPLAGVENEVKKTYRKDVVSPISPYGKEYFPAWLAIFPNTTTAQFPDGSTMHKDGIDLDLEIEEIDTLRDDGSKIIFECASPYIILSEKEIYTKEIISKPINSKNLSGTNINYRVLEKRINIKCQNGVLSNHTEIKVFAVLNTRKVEVGKLMLFKNNKIPKAKFVLVSVLTSPGQKRLSKDYEHLFKFRSFNQALIRAEVVTNTIFDITSLPASNADVRNFKSKYCNSLNTIPANLAEDFMLDLTALYDQYGNHKASGGINSGGHQTTYIFYTQIKAQTRTSSSTSTTEGIAYGIRSGVNMIWGNCYVLFAPQNASTNELNITIVHEAGHTLSLYHPFSSYLPYDFIQGTTDNVMDYSNQTDSNFTANPNKRNYISFWKWQWDTIRNDQSVK